MTQTKKIIVLEQSTPTVFITEIEHDPNDDMEVSVSDRLDVLGFNLDECSWMEVSDSFTNLDIKEM